MFQKRFFLTKQAALDIQEITEYIARDSMENAIRFADEFLAVCRSIPDFPDRGRIVPEVGHSQIREIIHKNYRLVYTVRKEKVFILQIFNAAKLFRMQDIDFE
ncbi:type II toxin-antitoxin system RelE/ParE family toxin [Pelotomaculum sp. FP]|uniref:type II toxin-antitoxin system RelE/ParE family toxin n=1 Tax=Pelotomaculum sp. FP TaxID=261474 RepID=UPI001065FFF0|nr:type II toxin-antitoxin system RelE/ParE family toxin [Pelotomaculum sp. FP]